MHQIVVTYSNSCKSNFRDFLFKDNNNKRTLLFTIVFTVLQFILFKLLYPFPDFFDDSYSYIYAAFAHLDISIWPIGYSKFLSLFHKITSSDTALVAFQFFFLQFGSIFFYFTINYFYSLTTLVRKILWSFLFINPLSLYLCNLINSDALFAALSITWLTQLIWTIQRPRTYQFIVQAILLFLCFTVRNNAYYYPLVTIIGYSLSGIKWKVKLTGIILPFLLIIPFILFTREAAYKLTGTRQFSLFSGWVLANNALYIYDKIEVDSTILPTAEAKELNRLSIDYFNHLNRDGYREYLESYVGNFFIKQPEAPLKRYARHHFQSKTEIGNISAWGKSSAAFEPFGKAIITHHPIAFLHYFIWPNFRNYIFPPLSNLEVYNYGINDIDPIAQYWFHYKTHKIHCISSTLQGYILFIYTALFFLCNLYLAWKLVGFSLIWYQSKSFPKIPLIYPLASCFALLNFVFSLVSTIDILRYQYTPMIVITTLGLLLSNYQFQIEGSTLKKKNPQISNSY